MILYVKVNSEQYVTDYTWGAELCFPWEKTCYDDSYVCDLMLYSKKLVNNELVFDECMFNFQDSERKKKQELDKEKIELEIEKERINKPATYLQIKEGKNMLNENMLETQYLTSLIELGL